MGQCRLPLWGIVAIWLVIVVITVTLSSFGVLQSAFRNQLTIHYDVLTAQVNHEITTVANQIVYDLRETAKAVYDSEPLLQQCDMPRANYSDAVLVRLFNSMSSERRPLGSLGIIQWAPNTTNGKVSWQVVAGYGCPTLMYAAAEPSTYPTFTGYCINATTGEKAPGPPAYIGTDWGLKPEEADMLVTQTRTNVFLPVFALLGYYTLTYEERVTCSGSNKSYAAVFAELSLAKLDATLADLTNKSTGASVILERTTGLLIGSSIPNQTQVNNSRVHLCNASAQVLRDMCETVGGAQAIASLNSAKSWGEGSNWVSATPYADGIDWVLLTSVPQTSFLTAVRSATGISVGTGVAVGVFLILVTVVGVYVLVSRRLTALGPYLYDRNGYKTAVDENVLDPSSGIAEIDDMLAIVKKQHGVTLDNEEKL